MALDCLVRSGHLVRVRRGAYVLREVHDAADNDEHYRLRTRAILRTRPEDDAASHHAAVLLDGVRTVDVDLRVVDLVSRVRGARVRSGLRTHPITGVPLVLVHGWRLVDLPFALCQVAASSGIVSGLCSMDHALHEDRCSLGDLRDAAERVPEHGRARARAAIDLADPLSESVGESRTRLLLHALGLPFVSQADLVHEGAFLGRVDFLVDGLVVVEFDGLVKYEGIDGRSALAAEKKRERGIWDRGYEVERVVWSDLDDPQAFARRIRMARIRALGRRTEG